jgi:hypothetical protein
MKPSVDTLNNSLLLLKSPKAPKKENLIEVAITQTRDR